MPSIWLDGIGIITAVPTLAPVPDAQEIAIDSGWRWR
jgi:hypothetical protein